MRESETRTALARWQSLLAMAAMAALAAGCGGSGGASADTAAAMLGVAKVVVRDAHGAPVASATVQQTTGASPEFTTDAEGVAFLIARPGPVSLSIVVPAFTPVVAQARLGLDAVTIVPVTLQHASATAGGSLSTPSGVALARSGEGRILDGERVVVGAAAHHRAMPLAVSIP